ncbi:hypothetical protein CNO14_04440 (plasmid) [Borrelia miyamotoi]|uniref:Uncharacterized protein n=1 Tax=Borrelia miyamotoi TaxID=47466 RepID=A0AAP8YSI8_9SPIR|nr:hypothetical protein [Borrelia miyamotoi]ATQ15254.1 hypothetical protein CNO14_04440 [Borrelia miyamotoi]ATQ16434.1 hypothetical protein CNO13_04425 [Borrelia miyamotoi]ATQ17583.1 hypothetical protein CNO12_04445 [Borrelia miyamotoi]ATQ18827.1 hypothetical protein CNO11_04435 [Borrelia miyamotoi]ATQ20077.1 hypothetical protein CNO10_04445 [Borrelia miyamotoi]
MKLDKIKDKTCLSDEQKDLSSIFIFNVNSDEHFKLKFLGSDDLLREQIASLLVWPEIVSNSFEAKDTLRDDFIVNFPSIDIDSQVDSLRDVSFKQDVNFTKGQVDSEEREVFADNLIKNILSNLVSSVMPNFLNLLKLPINDVASNVSDTDALDNNSLLNLDMSIFHDLNNLISDFLASPAVIPDKSGLEYLDIDSKLKGIGKIKKIQESKYSGIWQGRGVGGKINEFTYDDFESKKIEDILTSTGKFDTQVDMNDFIRKTCGFRSLLSKVEPECTRETLFDVVNLAGSLKGRNRYLQDNDSIVSVIYDLFQGNDENLSSIMDDLESSKGNFSNFDTGLDKNGDSYIGLKQRLKRSLLSLDENPDFHLSSSLDDTTHSDSTSSNLGVVSAMRDNNMYIILEEIREFLSWARSVNFERSIVEPLGTYFINMENVFADLTDTLMYIVQGASLQNNMKDYKMGNESSRMP